MHRMASIRRLPAALLATLALLTSCGGSDGVTPPPPPPTVATVVVTGGANTIVEPGDSIQLVAEASSASGAAIPSVTFTWSSADPAIATVSSSGWVKGAANGSTSINATAAGPSS